MPDHPTSICSPLFADDETAERYLLQHCSRSPHRRHTITKRGERWQCQDCGERIAVRQSTLFADTRVPVRKLLAAAWLFASAKRQLPADELSRTLGVTKSTARSILDKLRAHCGRYIASLPPFGSVGCGVVECDESYIGGAPRRLGPVSAKQRLLGIHRTTPRGRATRKQPVFAVVCRATGAAVIHVVDDVKRTTLHAEILALTDWRAVVVTDSWQSYRGIGRFVTKHVAVNHRRGEFLKFDEQSRTRCHSNTVESLFSVFKATVAPNVSRRHLQSYCDSVAFSWSTRDLSLGERFRVLTSVSPLRFKIRWQSWNGRLKADVPLEKTKR